MKLWHRFVVWILLSGLWGLWRCETLRELELRMVAVPLIAWWLECVWCFIRRAYKRGE